MSALQGLLSVVGRLFLVTIFLGSAVMNKIPHYGQVLGLMEAHHVPLPQLLLPGAIVFLIAGSLSVLVGYQARIGAALLAVFLVLATFYFHNFWAVPEAQQMEQMIQFQKNLGLLGAMLFLIANGPGAWSVDAARGR